MQYDQRITVEARHVYVQDRVQDEPWTADQTAGLLIGIGVLVIFWVPPLGVLLIGAGALIGAALLLGKAITFGQNLKKRLIYRVRFRRERKAQMMTQAAFQSPPPPPPGTGAAVSPGDSGSSLAFLLLLLFIVGMLLVLKFGPFLVLFFAALFGGIGFGIWRMLRRH